MPFSALTFASSTFDVRCSWIGMEFHGTKIALETSIIHSNSAIKSVFVQVSVDLVWSMVHATYATVLVNCDWFVQIANVSIELSSFFHHHASLHTWNDVVNADTTSYTISHRWPGSGLNGVNTYCIPNSGTNNNVALNQLRADDETTGHVSSGTKVSESDEKRDKINQHTHIQKKMWNNEQTKMPSNECYRDSNGFASIRICCITVASFSISNSIELMSLMLEIPIEVLTRGWLLLKHLK